MAGRPTETIEGASESDEPLTGGFLQESKWLGEGQAQSTWKYRSGDANDMLTQAVSLTLDKGESFADILGGSQGHKKIKIKCYPKYLLQ